MLGSQCSQFPHNRHDVKMLDGRARLLCSLKTDNEPVAESVRLTEPIRTAARMTDETLARFHRWVTKGLLSGS